MEYLENERSGKHSIFTKYQQMAWYLYVVVCPLVFKYWFHVQGDKRLAD